jgi:hypothetical protein
MQIRQEQKNRTSPAEYRASRPEHLAFQPQAEHQALPVCNIKHFSRVPTFEHFTSDTSEPAGKPPGKQPVKPRTIRRAIRVSRRASRRARRISNRTQDYSL